MTPEIKTYLELVVTTFEARLKGRGINAVYSPGGWLRNWGRKLYTEAKRLLSEVTPAHGCTGPGDQGRVGT